MVPELDVRGVPHASRHATVFGAFDAVPAGGALMLVAPHDPQPLLRQLTEPAGGALTVDDEQRAARTAGACCSPGREPMTYVIAQPCIDVLDRACVEECPVDCIYEGERALYIHPDECVDCGACEPVCPVEAIFYEDDVPGQWSVFTADNAAFFNEVLPGRATPVASPGGAAKLGPLRVDTPLVASCPPQGDAAAHG